MSISVEFVPLVSAVLVCLLGIYALVIKRSITLSERNTADLVDELSKEIQGISHGAMGVGRKVLMLVQALWGLKSTSTSLKACAVQIFNKCGFKPSVIDPDVWIRPNFKPNGEKHTASMFCFA